MTTHQVQPLDYRAIDVDNHYYEPIDSFTRHLPKEFKRRGVQMLTEGIQAKGLEGEKQAKDVLEILADSLEE